MLIRESAGDGSQGVAQVYNGYLSPTERAEYLREALAPHRADFVRRFGWSETHVDSMLEAFRNQRRRFSFVELERSSRAIESAAGRHYSTREAITTSQTTAAIGLITIGAILEAGADYPAIWRDLATYYATNEDSVVYPELFMDDLPHIHEETEPATESRMGAGTVRIRNYIYKRALVISRRMFEMDRTGQIKDFSTEFGKKYPIAQDRAFVAGVFKALVPANLIGQTNGFIPATNIAGATGGGYGFGTGASYAGVTGVPADFAPAASPVTPQAIENALLAPAVFTDPYGIEIGSGIELDTFFGDSLDRMKVKRYLTSQFNPVQPTTDPTGQGPGTHTDNVLKGEFTIATSPYVKKTRAPLSGQGYPWMMLKAKQSRLIMQERKTWSVEQEAENAGRSFDESSYRWKGEGEFGTGPASGRLVFVGN